MKVSYWPEAVARNGVTVAGTYDDFDLRFDGLVNWNSNLL